MLLKRAIAINSIIAIAWLLIFYPGFYSTDSFSAIRNAKSSNIVPGAVEWNIFVKAISANGEFPVLVVLVQALILNLSITLIAFHILKNKHLATFVSTTLCLTPTVGAIGITLWRDVPFTAGLFLLGPYAMWIEKEKTLSLFYRSLVGFLIGILLSFKQNGLPILLIICFSALVLRQYAVLKNLSKPFLVLLLAFFSIAIYTPQQRDLAESYAIEWMFSDVSCLASKFDDSEFQLLLESNDEIRSNWASIDACKFINRSKMSLDRDVVNAHITNYWSKFALSKPLEVLKIHIIRHSYLFPPLIASPPNIPFIHTTIEIPNAQITNRWPKLVEFFRNYPRSWNYFRALFSWSGLWLAVFAIFFIQSKHKYNLAIYLLIGISLSFSLFIAAPIPDARYSLFNLIIGQMVLMAWVWKIILRRQSKSY
jgi:hypothetical protein